MYIYLARTPEKDERKKYEEGNVTRKYNNSPKVTKRYNEESTLLGKENKPYQT